MNIFSKVLSDEYADDMKLGMPSKNASHMLRRAQAMSTMTNGNGFQVAPKEPRKDAHGRTRGDRKRAARAVAMTKVSEERGPEYMHSSARLRAGYAYDWRTNSYLLREAA